MWRLQAAKLWSSVGCMQVGISWTNWLARQPFYGFHFQIWKMLNWIQNHRFSGLQCTDCKLYGAGIISKKGRNLDQHLLRGAFLVGPNCMYSLPVVRFSANIRFEHLVSQSQYCSFQHATLPRRRDPLTPRRDGDFSQQALYLPLEGLCQIAGQGRAGGAASIRSKSSINLRISEHIWYPWRWNI